MRESSTDIHTLPSVNRQRVGSCCITRALSLVLCDEPEEWDGDGVEGRLEREGAFLLLFSRSIVSSFLWPHGLPHARLPCPSQSPGVCSSLCPLSWWCYLIISFLAPSSSFVFNLSQHTYIPEDICIPKLIHVVQQTPIPHCKAITLQLKTNLKKTPLKNVKKKKKRCVCVCCVRVERERRVFKELVHVIWGTKFDIFRADQQAGDGDSGMIWCYDLKSKGLWRQNSLFLWRPRASLVASVKESTC